MNRRHFLRCLPAAPIAGATLLAAAPAVAVQAALVEPAARDLEAGDIVDGREILDRCEDCSKPLFEGDRVFSYSDGPTFCEAHAPTWNDLKAMQDELIADGTFADHYDSPEDAARARESVLAHIADGQGDVKYVWSL